MPTESWSTSLELWHTLTHTKLFSKGELSLLYGFVNILIRLQEKASRILILDFLVQVGGRNWYMNCTCVFNPIPILSSYSVHICSWLLQHSLHTNVCQQKSEKLLCTHTSFGWWAKAPFIATWSSSPIWPHLLCIVFFLINKHNYTPVSVTKINWIENWNDAIGVNATNYVLS